MKHAQSLGVPTWNIGLDPVSVKNAGDVIGVKAGTTCGPFEAADTINGLGGDFRYQADLLRPKLAATTLQLRAGIQSGSRSFQGHHRLRSPPQGLCGVIKVSVVTQDYTGSVNECRA